MLDGFTGTAKERKIFPLVSGAPVLFVVLRQAGPVSESHGAIVGPLDQTLRNLPSYHISTLSDFLPSAKP